MRFICLFLLTALALTWPDQACAIDGQRPGFTCGIGLGYNSLISVSNDRLNFDKTGADFGLSLLIGAGTEHDLLTFELTGGEVEYRYPLDTIGSRILAFFEELRWYHYFGRTGRSVFSCVGFGVAQLDPSRSPFEGTGLNYVVGGGVEIMKELSLGVYFHGGYVEDDGYRHGVKLVQLLATIIAY